MNHSLGIAQLIATGLLWTVTGMIFSYAARRGLRLLAFAFSANFFTALLAWCACDWSAIRAGGLPALPAFTVLVSFGGLLNATGMLLIMAAMRRGHQAGSWTVSQSAMVVPFLAGMIIWQERPTHVNLAGMLLIFASLCLFGRRAAVRDADTPGQGWFGLAMLAFVLIGVSQTLFTVPSHWSGWTDPGRLRVPLLTSAAALVLGIIGLCRRDLPGAREMAAGFGCSFISLAGSTLLFTGMDNLAATGLVSLVYPLAVGTCIVGFGLQTRFRLKEPLGLTGTLALCAGVAGVLLLGMK